MKQRVLITGAEGMLGSYCNFGIRATHKELDVTDEKSVSDYIHAQRPQVIVHLAAVTDVAACEKDPAKTFLVNAAGTYYVAHAARELGARMIYVSTSGVFDGTKKEPYEPADIPKPLSVYGHSKYLGELAVQGMLKDYVIVRTSWLFGGGKEKDRKFVGKMLAQTSPEVRVVSDKRASPTYAKDLARALQTLCFSDAQGIVHIGGGIATRLELAKELFSLAKLQTTVTPVSSFNFPSAFVNGENESMLLSPLVRPWKEALREYVETEWKL